MILIVSIILTFSFALSAVFIGLAPNVYKLTDKDFMSKAYDNANLEALQLGDLYRRSHTLETTSSGATKEETSLFTYIVTSSGTTVSSVSLTSKITLQSHLTGGDKITANVTK